MKVLNFGSLNIDYTYDVDHFVRPGETLGSKGLKTYCGGKGLNQSCALAKAQAEAYHAGKIGPEGQFLIKRLEEDHAHTQFIHTDPNALCGHAIIQRDKEGDNSILLYGGANQDMDRAFIDEVFDYFTCDDVLVVQNEINEMPYILEKAHRKGMKIFLTPAPMNEELLQYPLEYVHTFLLNEGEAQALCGEEKEGLELALALNQKYPNSRFVLTLGGKGSMYASKTGIFVQKPYPVEAVDTTGAGDTFAGYYIAEYLRSKDPVKAMDLASRAAAISVTRPGASDSIPDLNEVLSF